MEVLEFMTSVFTICVISLIFLLLWSESHKSGRLPPDPSPFPIIGNLMHIDYKDVPSSLSKLAKEYGPVYMLYFGSQPTVILHEYEEKHNPETEFDFENLAICGLNLFGAGTETTSSNLTYCLLLLMKHPEVAGKVQKEIDRVIGCNQSPAMKDKLQMLYTEAVSNEIQRYINFVPSSVPHAVIQDPKFREYIIPKDTTVLPLSSSILYDCKELPNPEKFDPGHFLDENGSPRQTDYFIPFSLGKRACAVEGMACMELLLFLFTILQNFPEVRGGAQGPKDRSPRYWNFLHASTFQVLLYSW